MHAEEIPSADVASHLAVRCDLQVKRGQQGRGRKVRRVSEDIILLCSKQNHKFTAVTQSLWGGAQLFQLEWTFSGINPEKKAAAEVWWTVPAGLSSCYHWTDVRICMLNAHLWTPTRVSGCMKENLFVIMMHSDHLLINWSVPKGTNYNYCSFSQDQKACVVF